MPDLSIKAKEVGAGVAYVQAIGTIDATTFEKMESTIENLFGKGYYKLIINLEQVNYISSAGAGVFIGAVGTAQDQKGHILLLNPSTIVYDVFSVLGLLEIFPSAKTLEEAVAFFQSNNIPSP